PPTASCTGRSKAGSSCACSRRPGSPAARADCCSSRRPERDGAQDDMTLFLTFTVIGLVTGAVYAIAATGLVVTYTTSGIFNFAHGAIGMFMAFVFWQLTQAWGWPAFLSLLLVVLVIAPLFGALIERGLMRGLAGASATTT